MPIIDISQEGTVQRGTVTMHQEHQKNSSWEGFFSSLCARLFFVLLLGFDLLWFSYNVCKIAVCLLFHLCFLGHSTILQKKLSKGWISLKRAVICALALFVALFSPAFGIMIGCTYFLMYDKKGIEEVVPASLREQFKELFAQNAQE